MLILLSPAKTMNMHPEIAVPSGTTPQFQREAEFIVSRMQSYSKSQLQLALQISNKLSEQNYERYLNFEHPATPALPAIIAYTGNVFQHIRPSAFTEADYRYAQEHIRILSPLYGLLRPLDRIKAYRLPFQIKVRGMQEKNLYEYWLPKLTEPLLSAIRKNSGLLVNLASLDIQGAINMKRLENEVRILTPVFQEYWKGKYETVRTYAKMARGEMTRYILHNRLENPAELREFRWDGFRFCAELSDEKKYIFLKG